MLEHARQEKRSGEPTKPVSAVQGKKLSPAHLGGGPMGSLARVPRWAVDSTGIVFGPRSIDPHSPVGSVRPLTQHHDQVETEGDGARKAEVIWPALPDSDALGISHAPCWYAADDRTVSTRERALLEPPTPVSPQVQRLIDAQMHGGAPMESPLRKNMESVLGVELAHVRLHRGPEIDVLAQRLGGNAFTQGQHVFLRSDRNPDTDVGHETLAHELTHVVRGAPPINAVMREPANPA